MMRRSGGVDCTTAIGRELYLALRRMNGASRLSSGTFSIGPPARNRPSPRFPELGRSSYLPPSRTSSRAFFSSLSATLPLQGLRLWLASYARGVITNHAGSFFLSLDYWVQFSNPALSFRGILGEYVPTLDYVRQNKSNHGTSRRSAQPKNGQLCWWRVRLVWT